MVIFYNTVIPPGAHSFREYLITDVLNDILEIQIFYIEVKKDIEQRVDTLFWSKGVKQ